MFKWIAVVIGCTVGTAIGSYMGTSGKGPRAIFDDTIDRLRNWADRVEAEERKEKEAATKPTPPPA